MTYLHSFCVSLYTVLQSWNIQFTMNLQETWLKDNETVLTFKVLTFKFVLKH